jgi:hypothetical protein
MNIDPPSEWNEAVEELRELWRSPQNAMVEQRGAQTCKLFDMLMSFLLIVQEQNLALNQEIAELKAEKAAETWPPKTLKR